MFVGWGPEQSDSSLNEMSSSTKFESRSSPYIGFLYMSKMDIGLPILAWFLALILSKIGPPAVEDGMVVIETEVIGYVGMGGDDKKFGEGGRGGGDDFGEKGESAF